jgi:hypothetical protein
MRNADITDWSSRAVTVSVSVESVTGSYLGRITARMRRRHYRSRSAMPLVSVEVIDGSYLEKQSFRIDVWDVDITERSSRPVKPSVSVEADGGSYL